MAGAVNCINAVCSGSLGNAELTWIWGVQSGPLRTHTPSPDRLHPSSSSPASRDSALTIPLK
ncbi:Hypothetical predicted protein [Marmota monax]|uniref:Uncharacterized protein n=1 Tax=Marmota monax TaxID=9995 RepID=A0A5E4BTL1_MARMO|nr:Hypothetical predicted protein [Marmota monax]